LITLGIIGVVAAMTLPVLTAKWQEKAINSQFKRVYSNLYNAMRMIVAQEGLLPQCYYSESVPHYSPQTWSQCSDFYKELVDRLKVIKVCEGNAYRDGCIPKYKGVDLLKPEDDVKGCAGFNQNTILNKSYAFVMNDGSVFFTYNGPPDWKYSEVFAIDVNGKKGPNKWGHDVFAFAWKEQNKFVIMEAGTCQLLEDGGRDGNDILMNVQ